MGYLSIGGRPTQHKENKSLSTPYCIDVVDADVDVFYRVAGADSFDGSYTL